MERSVQASLRFSVVLMLFLALSTGVDNAVSSPQPQSGNHTHAFADTDNDGIPDELDPDDDNDGSPDIDDPDPIVTNPPPPDQPGDDDSDSDSDGDNIPEVLDPDDNNNGVSDDNEPLPAAPTNPGDDSSPSTDPPSNAGSSTDNPSQSAVAGNTQPLIRSLPDTGAGTQPSSLPPLLLSIATILVGATCSGLMERRRESKMRMDRALSDSSSMGRS